MTDKIFEYLIKTAQENERREWQERWKKEEESKPKSFGAFHADCKAGDLIEPAKKRAEHCRRKEKEFTIKLEEAEKELKEKGISLDVYDAATQTYQNYGAVVSGNMGAAKDQSFQPRVDQKLMDNVKNAKNKMGEYRDMALTYEKQARAFARNPEFPIRLSVEDIHYFRLGE